MGKTQKIVCFLLVILLGTVVSFAVEVLTTGADRSQEDVKIEQLRQKALEAKRLKLQARKADMERKLSEIDLPADNTPKMTVKDITINGNTLVTTEEIFKKMPLIFNASRDSLAQAKSEHLYDFRVLHDIMLEPGTDMAVSARTIQGFTQYVLSVYQDKNYAGIYVYVPAEAVEQGKDLPNNVLPVEVLEAQVSDVSVVHYDPNQTIVEKGYLDPNAVLAWSPAKEGKVANQKELDDFINLLNANPDRYVSAVVSKGTEPKTLAVNYDIYEVDPWHYFIHIDNSGTDDRRWSPRFGVINTNLLGIDDRFVAMYQADLESDIDDNYSVYGSYDLPVAGPRLRLRVYGGYSEYDISPEAGDFDFIGGGKFLGSALTYNVLQADGWFLDFSGSISYEQSKSMPSFLGLSLSGLGYDVKTALWGYGVNLHKSDDISNSSFSFTEVRSIGGACSDDNEYDNTRVGGGPAGTVFPDNDFSIATVAGSYSQVLDVNRVQRLTANFRLIYPSERLMPAKMTLFGGMYSVRGYDEYEIVADGGMLASAQYEFDLVKYERSKGVQPAEPEKPRDKLLGLKKLAPLAFVDFGRAKIESPRPTEDRHETLFSVGVGAHIELGDNFSGALYYGYPIKETDDTRRGKGRLHVGMMLRW